MSRSAEFTYLLMQIEPSLCANPTRMPGHKQLTKGMVFTNHFLLMAQTLMFMTEDKALFNDDFIVTKCGIFSRQSLTEWPQIYQKFQALNDVLDPPVIASSNKKLLKMAYFLVDYFEGLTLNEVYWHSRWEMLGRTALDTPSLNLLNAQFNFGAIETIHVATTVSRSTKLMNRIIHFGRKKMISDQLPHKKNFSSMIKEWPKFQLN